MKNLEFFSEFYLRQTTYLYFSIRQPGTIERTLLEQQQYQINQPKNVAENAKVGSS